jgi:hypothetical protein
MSDDSGPSPTPRYSRVVDASAGVAREMGHSYVGVEHLFLAMIRDRSAVPTQMLARSMDLDQVEASLLEVIASPEYNGAPPADAVWFPLSELSELVGVLPRCVPPGVEYGFNVAGDRAWIVVHEPGDTAAVVTAARALIERGGLQMGNE